MKKIMQILILVLSILTLVGCSKEDNNNSITNEEKNDRIQIGLSFDSFVIERWQRDRDVFISTAKELGADVNVQTASGSVEEQIDQIEYFIEKDMDVIVIVPGDADLLKDVVQKAKQKGIKVISYDRLIRNAKVDLYISFDNEKVGQLMAKSILDNVPEEGKVSVIFGPKSDYNVLLIEKGFYEVISKSNIQIVYKDYAKGWLAEEAFSAVNKTLELTDGIDGLVCGNDDLASQSIKALSEHRIADEVCVVGQDADLNACQRIVEGTQTMTVYKQIEQLAKKAAIYAVLLGKGEDIPIESTFNDGMNEVLYEKIEPIAVTKENIDQVIIDGGFHLREEVYLNVPSVN